MTFGWFDRGKPNSTVDWFQENCQQPFLLISSIYHLVSHNQYCSVITIGDKLYLYYCEIIKVLFTITAISILNWELKCDSKYIKNVRKILTYILKAIIQCDSGLQTFR